MAALDQVPFDTGLLSQRGVEKVSQVLPLLSQGNILYGQSAEALLQVLNARCGCRVLLLTIDQKEHKADYDERLNERREEEDNAHVVAAALAL